MTGSQPTAPPTVRKIDGKCFLVVCRDGQNAPSARATLLDGHLAHVERNWRRYVTAGPIRLPGEASITGSVFLVLADTEASARTLMEGDPYVHSGMYASIEYFEFTNSIGLFPGGKIWESFDAIRSRAAGGPT